MLSELIQNTHECWKPIFNKYENKINLILNNYEHNIIFPHKELIFKVFEMNIVDIKLIILGQDCYHGFEQANGLAFSVNNSIKIPPSLKNIYKEIKNSYPEKNYIFNHGNLERWAKEENIFLLNCSLCVAQGKPGSFMEEWKIITDDIIKMIAENNKNAIFLLLGNYAKEKLKIINNHERCIICAHPSPLSAYRGFIGSKIFKKIDEKLIDKINWSL